MARDDATTRTGHFVVAHGVASGRRVVGAKAWTVQSSLADVMGRHAFLARTLAVFCFFCARDALGFDD